jgi:F-box/leucine-rich repeat protein 2/20
MDFVPGVPQQAGEGVQQRFSTLLNKCMQQLQLLETDLQNSVTCVYKMKSIFTPGKEKCADPVAPLPSQKFLPVDQFDTSSLEPNQQNSQLQFRVQRREPTTTVGSDFVAFDEKNGPRLFSSEVWNFKFGSQGAPFRHRFQEQLKKVGLKMVDVRSDGNSQFRAFGEQVYGSEELHSLVRLLVMKDILANPVHYESLFVKGTDIQEYVNTTAKDGANGDHITLSAMASVYGADMLIFSPLFPRPVLIRPRCRTTDRAYCLAYVNRHQYQALRSAEQSNAPTAHVSAANDSARLSAFSNTLETVPYPRSQPSFGSSPTSSSSSSSCSSSPAPAHRGTNSLPITIAPADRMDLDTFVSSPLGVSPSTAVSPSTTPLGARHSDSILSPDQGKNKIRKLNTRKGGVLHSLTDLCLNKITEYVEFLPPLNDALPEDLSQRLLTHLNKEGKIDDQVLEKVLDSSITSLDLSHCKQLADSSCIIIASRCSYLRRLVIGGCISITSAGLESIAQSCPQLEEVDIEGCCNVGDTGVQAIARHCNQLRVINLAGCLQLTNATVRDLSCLCPEIASISLKKCSQITDPVFGGIGDKLQQLDLSECPQITDAAIMELANKSSSNALQSLKLAGKNITDGSIKSLAAQCPNLRDLELFGCESITDASVHFLARSCTQLQVLNLTQCKNISDAAFSILNSEPGLLSNLQCLDLTRCTKVGDEGVCSVAQSCRGLVSLNLTSCEGVTDVAINAIANSCEYLRTLILGKCKKVTDASVLELVQRCRSITVLDLQRCGITNQSVVTISATCAQLRELDVSATDITDDCIPLLSNLTKLEGLGLEDVRLTETGVSAISNCTSLSSLKLAYCTGVTDLTLEKLAQLSLKSVDFSYCNSMTAKGFIQTLPRWPQLKTLVLKGFNHLTTETIEHSFIENLTLSWCKHLEDKAVVSLVDCPRLTTLDLAWCAKITGNSLHKLAQQCPLLKTLNLRGCNKIAYLTLKFLKASGRTVFR